MTEKQDKSWSKSIEHVTPLMFKIETSKGSGSGFYISSGFDTVAKKKIAVIATADHVVHHAFRWNEPIELFQFNPPAHKKLFPGQYRQLENIEDDLALIIIDFDLFNFSVKSFKIVRPESVARIGVTVGWCGFPAIPGIFENKLCFFSGCISAYLNEKGDYLIDGNVISGVSGAPAFTMSESATIMGVVTHYILTGEKTPGLSLIRNLRPITQLISERTDVDMKK